MAVPTTDAWIFERHRGLSLVRREPPPLKASEVEVSLVVGGLCRTDVAVANGRKAVRDGLTLGHEGAGVVTALGSGCAQVHVGDPVAIDPRLDGGFMGLEQDGLFARRFAVPEGALHILPPGLSWRKAAYLEPVAASLAVLDHVTPEQTLRLTGEGRIAELTRRILRHQGRERFVEQEADVVVETGGTKASLERAVAAARREGTIVLKSRPIEPLPLAVSAVVGRRLRLVGADYGPFERALELLSDPGFEIEDLLGPVFEMAALPALLERDERTKPFLSFCPEEARRCVD